MTKYPKSLTVIATAAALVAGVAFAQTNLPPQPEPNTTGQSGSALGAQQPGTVDSGSTMNNSGAMGATGATGGTTGSGVDNSGVYNNNAQSDIVSPEPRADRN